MDPSAYNNILLPAFVDGPGPNFDLEYGVTPKSQFDGPSAPANDWGGKPQDTITQNQMAAFLKQAGVVFGGQLDLLGLQVETILQSGSSVPGIIPGQQARDNSNLDEDALRWSAHVSVMGFSSSRFLVMHIVAAFLAMPNTKQEAQTFFSALCPGLDVAAALAVAQPPLPFYATPLTAV